MTEHFGKFGEVEECVIMKDQNTGNPRGFGFVQFKDPQCVVAALSSGPHVVDKKTVSACMHQNLGSSRILHVFMNIGTHYTTACWRILECVWCSGG